MTTYRTGNAIGSADPRDLYDNAENLDEFVNSKDKLSHPDRLGVPRKTWHGMEQDFQQFLLESGYQLIEEEYGPGIEVTARNQVILADGEYWRASASTALPYTTDGSGMPEGGAFVAVGDAVLRQELAAGTADIGGQSAQSVADLRGNLLSGVSGGGGALNVRGAVVYLDAIADMKALDPSDLADGHAASVKGSEFTWNEAGSSWVARNVPNAASFGLAGSVSAAAWQSAIDDCIAFGAKSFRIPFDVTSLDGAVDCKEIRLICQDTVLPSSTNTFVNHGGVENGIIAGVHTSRETANITRSPKFEKTKFVRRSAANTYLIYTAKNNPDEGYLEYRSQDNVVTESNSIGGDSATRITNVRNINDIIGYRHEYDSANHSPDDSTTRTVGGGTGGVAAAFWNIPASGGLIRFYPGAMVSEISILFLLSGNSSNDVEIRWNGVPIDTISLSQPPGGPDWFIYRRKVVAGNAQITIINNGSGAAYVGGVNCYRPGENFPSNLLIDTLAYSRNANDYTDPNGAVDYALRRHPDEYQGDDPTGGSFHGGEEIISDNVYLDGGVWQPLVGSIGVARRVELIRNVRIVWPSDNASVNVVCLNQIGDGHLFKDMEIRAGDVVFDAVWTAMWTTPASIPAARGLIARDISGVSSEFVCYDRGNEIRQDRSVGFGVRNSWTLFSDERNSNGGPYIASEGARNKLYYGPILFNKGKIGNLHTQQFTEFFGKD